MWKFTEKQNPSRHAIVEFVIQDFKRPMGVATYTTAEDMPEQLRKALPDMDELRQVLNKEIKEE